MTTATTTTNGPTTKTWTRRIIWKCSRCKSVVAHDYTASKTLIGTDRTYGSPIWSRVTETRIVDGVRRDVSWDAACPCCKGHRKSATVKGVVTEHECDARCMASTGPVCECSCGGKNHGRSHLA
jgi:hypothetical protein